MGMTDAGIKAAVAMVTESLVTLRIRFSIRFPDRKTSRPGMRPAISSISWLLPAVFHWAAVMREVWLHPASPRVKSAAAKGKDIRTMLLFIPSMT